MGRALTEATRKRAREVFLDELARRGIVQDAAAVAGLTREWFYSERKNDEAFARQWDTALDVANDRIEREAYRRAVEGVDEPVFGRVGKDQDGEVGVIRRYSDTILLRLLGARRPGVWRERTAGALNVTVTPAELAQMSDDDLERLKQQLG